MIYRANFTMLIVLDILGMAIPIIFFGIIFNQNKYIAGWNFGSVLVLIGVVGVLRELAFLFFREGFGMLGHLIPKGRFDLILTKPFSPQLLVAFQEVSINESLGEALLGLGLIIYGIMRANIPVTFFNVLFFILLIICSFVLYYSFALLINSAAFWVYRTQGFHSLVATLLETARYPRDVLKGFFKIFFTFAVPASIIATVPAQALIGKLQFESVVILLFVTLAFFILANFVWRRGIRRYESASS